MNAYCTIISNMILSILLFSKTNPRSITMTISISETKDDAGKYAAFTGANMIKEAIARQGHATIILATGLSQIEMLRNLVQADIKWDAVEVFHLDEYVGISATHRASFRKYLKENFEAHVHGLKAFHYITGNAPDLDTDIARLNALISRQTIDVAFVGIGENGHLAFNDPPADFNTDVPYLVVSLNEACKKQQVHEGWFPSVETTPPRAVSMSICQIMKSTCIINTVPDYRKAQAVTECLTGPVSPTHPASILQRPSDCYTFLDRNSASLLCFRKDQD